MLLLRVTDSKCRLSVPRNDAPTFVARVFSTDLDRFHVSLPTWWGSGGALFVEPRAPWPRLPPWKLL